MNPSSNPLISIVIPHFNRVELLRETLASIKSQQYQNWEVLVVDDGSSDKQWSALGKLVTDQIRVFKRLVGMKGPSCCRNLGVSESRGDYVLFVDSDDLLSPWCLSQRMNLVVNNPEFDCWIYPVMLFRDKPGDLDVCWNRLEGDDDLERFLRSDTPWHTSSPIWRKQVFLDIGGFNQKVFYGDDEELHIRALLEGVKTHKFIEYLPDLFIRRSDEQRITNSRLSFLMSSRRVRLAEGSRLLQKYQLDSNLVRLWEGQYFMECEELLFNLNDSASQIDIILKAWISVHQPDLLRRWLVRSYFSVAKVCLDRAYWVLRLARRFIKFILPIEYINEGGHFQSWKIKAEAAAELRKMLSDCQQTEFTS